MDISQTVPLYLPFCNKFVVNFYFVIKFAKQHLKQKHQPHIWDYVVAPFDEMNTDG